MSAFYANPRRYPPRFHIWKRGDGTYARGEYAGMIEGKPIFPVSAVYLTADDAVNQASPIPAEAN